MIYADLKDLSNYYGISHNLDTAITYLKEGKYMECQKGRNEVDGDNVFVNCMEYTTIEEEEGVFEAHQEYLDIHVMGFGQEKIAVSDIGILQETKREEKEDYILFEGQTQCYCPMDSSKFLVVFPRDAHKVKIKENQKENVRKIVVKVKVEKGE